MGHILMENRNGLVVDVETTHASGTAEREAAKVMAYRSIGKSGGTLGADKGYDVAEFVGAMRKARVSAQMILTFAAYNLTRIASIFGWRLSTA